MSALQISFLIPLAPSLPPSAWPHPDLSSCSSTSLHFPVLCVPTTILPTTSNSPSSLFFIFLDVLHEHVLPPHIFAAIPATMRPAVQSPPCPMQQMAEQHMRAHKQSRPLTYTHTHTLRHGKHSRPCRNINNYAKPRATFVCKCTTSALNQAAFFYTLLSESNKQTRW